MVYETKFGNYYNQCRKDSMKSTQTAIKFSRTVLRSRIESYLKLRIFFYTKKAGWLENKYFSIGLEIACYFAP